MMGIIRSGDRSLINERKQKNIIVLNFKKKKLI